MSQLKLTRSQDYMAKALLSEGKTAITHYAFFCMLQSMYKNGEGLHLRREKPKLEDHSRHLKGLYRAGLIRYDRDYGKRLIRVLEVSEHSTEEIVCLADPLCYVSHLSAMQRWGLTDRAPLVLTCTRPSKAIAVAQLQEIMAGHPLPPERVRLRNIRHPETVRGRPLQIIESKKAGAWVKIPRTNTRVATIGQTFLDMLQDSRRCGGMYHVLDVYAEYASQWTNNIITAVDSCDSDLVKVRAGYILEERLGLSDARIDSWKTLVQRGGSRKLDPLEDYSPDYSETWKLSLNV